MRKGEGRQKARRLAAVLAAVGLITVAFYGIRAGLSFSERIWYPIRYDGTVRRCAAFFGVPESVVYAVIRTESGFDEAAVSRAGACGLMQLMPETYRAAAAAIGRSGEEGGIFDPDSNIACGCFWLARLYRKYQNWETVFAAYNAGETAVDRWLSDPETGGGGRLLTIPYPETETYVRRVAKAQAVYRRQYKTIS